MIQARDVDPSDARLNGQGRMFAAALACRLLARLRHADYIEQCPSSRAKRKTFAHSELFAHPKRTFGELLRRRRQVMIARCASVKTSSVTVQSRSRNSACSRCRLPLAGLQSLQ